MVPVFNLVPVVGRGRVGCDAVRGQGAPTQWADADQEKQRSQRAVARLNRLRSVLTRWVMAGGERNLNGHAAFAAVGSGQLPDLGLISSPPRKITLRSASAPTATQPRRPDIIIISAFIDVAWRRISTGVKTSLRKRNSRHCWV